MKIKLIALTLLSYGIIGCAPIPVNQSPPVKVTLKEIPKITQMEKGVLQNNGFSSGLWSKDCNDKDAYTMRFYEDFEKYMAESSTKGKKFSRGQFYEPKLISKQVIQFKMQTVLDNGIQEINLYKTGFIAGKRLTFDMTTLYLSGPNAGKEEILAKDGFIMNRQKDGSYIKGSAVTPFFKCN